MLLGVVSMDENASRELGVQIVVDIRARDVRVQPHVSELQAVERIAVYGSKERTTKNTLWE